MSLLAVAAAMLCAADILDFRIEPNPHESAPLVLRCDFAIAAAEPASLILNSGNRQLRFQSNPAETRHEFTMLGLKPDTNYRLDIAVDKMPTTFRPIVLKTPALPDWFPPIRCTVARPDRMEPGVTLMVIYRWIDQALDREFGLLVAVDERGEIVWHYRPRHPIHAATLLDNGRLLCIVERAGTMIEIDFLGAVHRRMHTTGIPKPAPISPSVAVDTDTFHHDAIELPNGNMATLSTEIRRLPDYPTSETDPNAPRAVANVIGDVIVEFDATGRVVRQIRLLDVLDPYRMGYDSLGTQFWQRIYADRENWNTRDEWPRDWSHANSLDYDETGDAYIVSLYHQDAVIKLHRTTGELVWILGTPDGWRQPWRSKCLEPIGELSWPYHQHAAKLLPNGNLLLFDNGKYRARPFDPPMDAAESYSRAVEYAIDEQAKTVREVWSCRGDGFYSSFLGDVSILPQTGNILITDGGEISLPDGTPAPLGLGKNWASVMEVTRDERAESVFELQIRGDQPQVGWSIYRSMRIPWSVFSPQLANRR